MEIKCLESKQDMSPETAINNHEKESSFPFMELNSVFVVKEKHKYWFQPQMQLGVSGMPLTDFVIQYLPTTHFQFWFLRSHIVGG